MIDNNLIERYKPGDRINHWVTAITFIMLALSGLALFHPVFYWLTNLFGGGAWTRILHPFIGVVLEVSFWLLARRFWALNRITDADREWMRRIRDVLAKREQNLPEVGYYNAGQKYLFWVMVTMIALLLVSGIVLWQPWFAPWFPVGLIRVAALVHALAAFVIIAGVIVHIYAAIWVKGSIRAMTRGTVSRAWARHHHPGWYREVNKGSK
ncbi:MAG: formate dehydrogenase subunit gamma [Sulfuricaulis sp.]